MATQIIATGTGASTSSDVVVAAGTPVTVGLKGTTDGKAFVSIQLYDGAAYVKVGSLDSFNLAKVIDGPGTYRFVRDADSGTCGVFSG